MNELDERGRRLGELMRAAAPPFEPVRMDDLRADGRARSRRRRATPMVAAIAAAAAVAVLALVLSLVSSDNRNHPHNPSGSGTLAPAELQAAKRVAHREADSLANETLHRRWPRVVSEVTVAAASRKMAVSNHFLQRPHVCEAQQVVLVRIEGMFPMSFGGPPPSGSGNTQWITVVTLPGSTRICDVAVSAVKPAALRNRTVIYRQ